MRPLFFSFLKTFARVGLYQDSPTLSSPYYLIQEFVILVGTVTLIHSNWYLIMIVLYFKACIRYKIMFGKCDNRQRKI